MTSLPEAGSWASSQLVRRLSSATASQITASRAHHSSTFDKSIVKLSAFKCVMSQSCRFSMLCLLCRLTADLQQMLLAARASEVSEGLLSCRRVLGACARAEMKIRRVCTTPPTPLQPMLPNSRRRPRGVRGRACDTHTHTHTHTHKPTPLQPTLPNPRRHPDGGWHGQQRLASIRTMMQLWHA